MKVEITLLILHLTCSLVSVLREHITYFVKITLGTLS